MVKGGFCTHVIRSYILANSVFLEKKQVKLHLDTPKDCIKKFFIIKNCKNISYPSVLMQVLGAH